MRAVKLSLVAKKRERTEQIKRNLGDKISMNSQCKGKGDGKSKLTLRLLTFNTVVVPFKDTGNNGKRAGRGDR